MDRINARGCSDVELLARVLGTELEAAAEIIETAGGLARLGEARHLDQLPNLHDAVELVGRLMASQLAHGPTITSEADAGKMIRHLLRFELREVFVCMFMDSRHRVLATERLSLGTIDGAEVHPREVVRRAIHHNAAAVIAGHNHPSGNPEPSVADRHITKRLQSALGLIDVRLLDHIIIGGDSIVSLAARGMI